jgi:catechol 1,2-dioxygenase
VAAADSECTDTLDQTRAQRKAAGSGPSSKEEDNTSFSAILGPFYRTGVPIQPNGTTIIRQEEPDAPYTHLYGTIHGADGKPLPNAIVDVWHDAVSPLFLRACYVLERG